LHAILKLVNSLLVVFKAGRLDTDEARDAVFGLITGDADLLRECVHVRREPCIGEIEPAFLRVSRAFIENSQKVLLLDHGPILRSLSRT